jgi:predicted nucleic acid-binding protein
MSGPVFVDTNVLVYARDASEKEKQPRAFLWLSSLWESRKGRLSFQVLHEYYVTVTQKLTPGLKREEARRDVRALMTWRPIPWGAPLLDGAWAAEQTYGLSFWDALIVSAAQLADCAFVLTEDLQHGQSIDGLKVLSPFREDPRAIL